jgi:hypothetical protein
MDYAMMVHMSPTDRIHPFEKVGLGKAPFRVVGFSVQKYQACYGAPVQPGSSCDFCGTSIMNVFSIQGADGSRFKVGIDCVKKTYDKALHKEALASAREVKRKARTEAREASRAESAKTRREAFVQANPGIEVALACGHEITNDLASKLDIYGSLSTSQVELAFRLHSQTYCPAKRPEVNGKAPIGPRQTIRGRIISVRLHDGYMGTKQLRMTVKVVEQKDDADYVWLCWGTVPREIAGHIPGQDDLRNAVVEFTASLEAGREPHFGLFKRPTKARIVDGVQQ